VTRRAYSTRVPRPLVFLLLASCAAREPADLVMAPVPVEAPRAGIAWRMDGEPALMEARTKRKAVLLYFTAGWDATGRALARDVFPTEEVRAAAAEFVALQINVDRSESIDLCRTWEPESGVPGFVILGVDGSILEEWSGALPPRAFAVRLLRGKHRAKVPDAYRERWDRAARMLMSGDVQPLRDLIAALDHAGERDWAKRLSLMECREHYYRYRWSLCVEACDLTLRRWPGTAEAARLRARATYRTTGEIDPATRARIDALVAAAAKEESVAELVAVGEPAVDALLHAVIAGKAEQSAACAQALGRIRASRVLPDLIAALDDRTLRNPVRARVAAAMEPWCDPAFLPVLVRHLDDPREAANVRIACARAVRRLGESHGGLYGATVVEPLFRALSDRSPELRFRTLQALRTVRDEFDVSRLFATMGDDRAASEGTVADEACDLFCARVGHRLQDAEGRPVGRDVPPGTGLFLERWWQANAFRLAWDPAATRYVPRRPRT